MSEISALSGVSFSEESLLNAAGRLSRKKNHSFLHFDQLGGNKETRENDSVPVQVRAVKCQVFVKVDQPDRGSRNEREGGRVGKREAEGDRERE